MHNDSFLLEKKTVDVKCSRYNLILDLNSSATEIDAITHNYTPIIGIGVLAFNQAMIAVIKTMKDTFRSIQTKPLPVTHLKVFRTKNIACGIELKSRVQKCAIFTQ